MYPLRSCTLVPGQTVCIQLLWWQRGGRGRPDPRSKCIGILSGFGLFHLRILHGPNTLPSILSRLTDPSKHMDPRPRTPAPSNVARVRVGSPWRPAYWHRPGAAFSNGLARAFFWNPPFCECMWLTDVADLFKGRLFVIRVRVWHRLQEGCFAPFGFRCSATSNTQFVGRSLLISEVVQAAV